MTNFTELKNLNPGQTFYHQNVSHSARNECVFVGITKTPSGRDSFNYKFNGKMCKGKASERVIIVD